MKAYFTLPEAPEGEIAYQSVNGTAYPESKTVIFDVANATAGTMKRRGRKRPPDSTHRIIPAEVMVEMVQSMLGDLPALSRRDIT